MQHIAKQLESIRSTSRKLLIAQRLMQWSSVILLIAIVFCFLDYWLRLPSELRLIIDMIVIVAGGYWIFSRLKNALNYMPRLSTLALKAERLFPSLQGVLATGVDFSIEQNKHEKSDVASELIRDAVVSAEEKLGDVNLKDLYDMRYTYKCLGYSLGVALVLIGAVFIATPHNAMVFDAALVDAVWRS